VTRGVNAKVEVKTQPDWSELPFIIESISSKAADHDRSGTFAFANYERLHRHGFLALPIAREFGGIGASLRDCLRLLEQVAQADASTALVLSMYFNLHGMQARRRTWPEPLYARVAEESLKRVSLINALNYEPELGSPVRGTGTLETVARAEPGGWRISGRKRYATGSAGLRWFTVAARNEDGFRGSWFVEADSPGISIVENWDHIGLRATASHDVVLSDVFVPYDHLVSLATGSANGAPAGGRNWSNATWNAIYLAISKAARDFLVAYLRSRAPGSLGHSLAELPHMQDAVGRIELLIRAGERLNLAMVDELDRGLNAPFDIDDAMTKLFVRDYAKEAVQIAAGAIGNAGLSREFPLERHLRDIQFGPNHPPASDVIRRIAADSAFRRSERLAPEGTSAKALRKEKIEI
jgi:alkylation response protein AidB-like acyl-CoA dehydrogenase